MQDIRGSISKINFALLQKQLAESGAPSLDPATHICPACGKPSNGGMCGWDLIGAERFKDVK